MSGVTTQQPAATPAEIEAAALKAAGFDRCDQSTRIVVSEIARRYGLEIMLRHMLPVEGKPYITRDGLLHVAHKSGMLDGIVLEDTGYDERAGGWWAVVSVYRKDMKHPFKYRGRYNGPNKKYGPEMAVKCSEVMGLRRAFDVALCSVEELGIDDTAHEVAAPQIVAQAQKVAAEQPAQRVCPDAAFRPLMAALKAAGLNSTEAIQNALRAFLQDPAVTGQTITEEQAKRAAAHFRDVASRPQLAAPVAAPAGAGEDPDAEARDPAFEVQ